jgi:hypothetical protein
MKRPPCQLRDSLALEACDAFIEGRSFAFPTHSGPQIAERRYLAADI